MARYDFVSPGAAAGNAIQQFLVQRELQQRQQMLDQLAQQKQAEDIRLRGEDLSLRRAQEQRVAEMQRQTFEDLANEREFRRATTIADKALPGDITDEPTAALLREHGYGSQIQQADAEAGVIPGTGIPTVTPGILKLRGGSQYLSARAAADERAAAAREAQAARAAESELNRQSREDIAREGIASREQIATMMASNNAETRALGNQLRQLQIDQAQEKLDTTRTERVDKQTAVATTRAEIRDLAQGLLDDPALDAITGPIAARTPDVQPESVEVARRFTQLKNRLTLGQRDLLKGQGAVSDWEGRLVEGGASALDRAAGPANVRKHLKDIVEAFQGDAPRPDRRTTGGKDGAPPAPPGSPPPAPRGRPPGPPGAGVLMRTPDGRLKNVPPDQVEAAKARGARPM